MVRAVFLVVGLVTTHTLAICQTPTVPGPPASLEGNHPYDSAVSANVEIDQEGVPECQRYPMSDSRITFDFFRCEGICRNLNGDLKCQSTPRDKEGRHKTNGTVKRFRHEIWPGTDFDQPPLKGNPDAPTQYVEYRSAYCLAKRRCGCHGRRGGNTACNPAERLPWFQKFGYDFQWHSVNVNHAKGYRFAAAPSEGEWLNYGPPSESNGDGGGLTGSGDYAVDGGYGYPHQTYYGSDASTGGNGSELMPDAIDDGSSNYHDMSRYGHQYQ